MEESNSSKARILDKINQALQGFQAPKPFPDLSDEHDFFTASDKSVVELFAENFTALGGKFVYCADEAEALSNLAALYDAIGLQKLFCAEPNFLLACAAAGLPFVLPADNADDTADACITDCEAGVARTGSFLVSAKQNLGRVSTIFYPVHIVLSRNADLVYDIADGYDKIKQKYNGDLPSMISLQTGPSRTADIEKTLVTGVHGPKEVYCLFIDN